MPLFILLLCFFSQVKLLGQVYVGPIAGSQLSWVRFDDDQYYDAFRVRPRAGWHAGANVSMKVRNRFFLHTSLLYATKGRTIKGRYDRLLKNKSRYDYIEMPIIYSVDFRGTLDNGKQFKYYIGVGPTISYWLSGKGTLYNSDLAESGDYSERPLKYRIAFGDDGDAQPNTMTVSDPNHIQLALNLASGLVFEPMPNQRVLLMMRYEFGHSFLSRTGGGTFVPTYYTDVLQSRNKGLRLSVSYMIDLRIEDRKRGKSTIKKSKMQ